jgi:hypothetical protein
VANITERVVRKAMRLIFKRGFQSQPQVLIVGDWEKLSGSSVRDWLLAQEKARLEYTARKELYTQRPEPYELARLLEALLALQSTNAMVQSLINEVTLEKMVARGDGATGKAPVGSATPQAEKVSTSGANGQNG